MTAQVGIACGWDLLTFQILRTFRGASTAAMKGSANSAGPGTRLELIAEAFALPELVTCQTCTGKVTRLLRFKPQGLDIRVLDSVGTLVPENQGNRLALGIRNKGRPAPGQLVSDRFL